MSKYMHIYDDLSDAISSSLGNLIRLIDNTQSNFITPPFKQRVITRHDGDNYIVEIPTPGIQKERLSVSYDNDILNVECKPLSDLKTNRDKIQFSESIKIPFTIKSATAKYENGVLFITLVPDSTSATIPIE